MAMYKSFFDLPPEQTASTAMPRTVVFSNGTGEREYDHLSTVFGCRAVL